MSTHAEGAFDKLVRRHAYDFTEQHGLPRTIAETAAALSRTHEEIAASFRQLADEHLLVLQRDGGEILMLPPYSAVPTPFVVESGGRSYFANCIWDALGVPAMLKRDALIETSCACCGSAARLRVEGGALAESAGLVHFALPAARWWDNVVFT